MSYNGRYKDHILFLDSSNDIIPRDKLFDKLVREADKLVNKDFKASEGIIIILGPNPKNNTQGARLRKFLKERMNKHIDGRWGKETAIGAYFPEDAEIKSLVKRMSLDTEAHIFKNDLVKLIFCVWSEDATGLITEITHHMLNNIIAMKLRILVDEELINTPSYTSREILDSLSSTFNNLYPFNFSEIDPIVEKSLEILDAHHEWAVAHNNTWAYDIPKEEREQI